MPKIDALVARKQIFVKKLYEELSRLDAGEAVESFGDEKRRIVYYEEQESKFFTLDNGIRKYLAIQDVISKEYQNKAQWTKRSITNVARSGYFSSDRTIREYASEIWGVPCK